MSTVPRFTNVLNSILATETFTIIDDLYLTLLFTVLFSLISEHEPCFITGLYIDAQHKQIIFVDVLHS